MKVKASPILSPDRPARVGFDRFIGIDWSGAQGEWLSNIAVATVSCGKSAPQIMRGPMRGLWSRPSVLEFLAGECGREDGRTLVGVDFAFAYPFVDGNGYFPGADDGPRNHRKLWELVDKHGHSDAFLYGMGITKAIPWKSHFHTEGKMSKFRARWRGTEKAARNTPDCKPKSSFLCAYSGQVGRGTLAGMRMLHALKKEVGDKVAVWPFDAIGNSPLVAVEIYPRFFFACAKIKAVSAKRVRAENLMRQAVRELNDVLAHFDAAPLPENYQLCGKDLDERDAIASAAALRRLSREKGTWALSNKKDREAAEKEGWIFGVKSKTA